MTSSHRRRAIILALALLTVGCDRVTKRIAVSALKGVPRRSFLADTVRLEYIENRGAFLGLGANLPLPVRTLIFTVGTSVLLAAIAVMSLRREWTARAALGVALAWAGGMSNLVDRAARGTVVDFLNVGIGPVRTGIFNVADMAILAGAILVAWPSARPDPSAVSM